MVETYTPECDFNTKAHDFELENTDGKFYKLGELVGEKATLIMFICNHCPYVKHVNATIVNLAKKYKQDGINFIAISSNDVENYPEDSPKLMKVNAVENNYIFPFVVGAAFAFGWTPCIGPVLGSILALSATEASISSGILLLSFYSLGLAIPFILSGYFMNSFLTSKKGFGKYYNRVTKIGGAVLLITGILITTNQIQVISYYILTTFPFLTSLG